MASPDPPPSLGADNKSTQAEQEVVPDVADSSEALETLLTGAMANAEGSHSLPVVNEPQRAEIRRQEFKQWMVQKSFTTTTTKRSGSTGTPDDRRQRRLKQLQERLAAAEQSRLLALEQVRQRAAVLSSGRGAEALARQQQERQQLLAHKIYDGLRAAEGRRQALKEAERERLRSGRQLVFTRLALSQERAAAELEEQRKRTEARLQQAEDARNAKLSEAATRAGDKVKKVRSAGALSRALAEQEAAQRGTALERRLFEAEQRRSRTRAMGPTVARRVGRQAGSDSPDADESGSSAAPSPTALVPMRVLAAEALQAAEVLQLQAAQAAMEDEVLEGGEEEGSVAASPSASSASGSLARAARGARDERDAARDEREAAQAERDALLLLERANELRRNASSRRLQQCWRLFVRKRRTTAALADAFVETGVTGLTVASTNNSEELPTPSPAAASAPAAAASPFSASTSRALPPPPLVLMGALSDDAVGHQQRAELDRFEKFATALRAPSTLKAAQVLLHRLEVRLAARGALSIGAGRLLRRLFPQAPKDRPLDRYPARVFLCAYMVMEHPEVVFSKSGEQEARLAAAGNEMLAFFEALLQRILEPTPLEDDDAAGAGGGGQVAASPVAQSMRSFRMAQMHQTAAGQGGLSPSGAGPAPFTTIGQHLVRFDEAWMRYLDQFVAWKFEDAASLEGELLRVAVEMEVSMRRKCRGGPESARVRRSSDLQALVEQVRHDHSLLRERIANLSGPPGLARLEEALEKARWAVHSESETETDRSDDDRAALARGGLRVRLPSNPGIATAPSPSGGSASTSAAAASSPALPGPSAPAAAAAEALPILAAADGAAALAAAAARPPPPPVKPKGMASGFFNRAPKAVAAPRPQSSASPAAPSTPPATSPHSSQRLPSPSAAAGAAASGGVGARAVPLMIPSPRRPSGAGDVSVGWSPAASLPQSPSALPPPRPDLPAESFSNVQMVMELVHNPEYQLSSEDATAAWQRALGGADDEQNALSQLDPSALEAMGPEQLLAFLRGRARVVAERAWWDNAAARLESGLSQAAGVLPLVIPLLSEIASELAGLVSDPTAAAGVRGEMSEEALTATLVDSAQAATAGPVGRLQMLLGAVSRLADLLLQWGAPAREADALAAQHTLREELTTALTAWAMAAARGSGSGGAGAVSGASSPAAGGGGGGAAAAVPPETRRLAAALSRALRLLSAQLKLLKLDAANGRLMLLARSLRGTDGAVAYLQTKFAALYRLPPPAEEVAEAGDVAVAGGAGSSIATEAGPSAPAVAPATPHFDIAAALPRTAHWLKTAQAAGAAAQHYLASAGIHLDAALHERQRRVASETASHLAAAGLPAQLRTGTRQRVSASSGPPAGPPPALKPDTPVALASWRGAVRAGAVALVAGEAPAVSRYLAETLAWDAERLHAAQNDFQQLLVVTAGLLLVGQMRHAAATAAAAVATAAAAAEQADDPDAAPAAASPKPAIAPAAASAAAPAAAVMTWTAAEQTTARRRLLVVLADPGMRLPDLVSELAALAGAIDVAAEAKLRSAFMSLVEPGSPGFRSISAGLASLLLAQLLLGAPASALGGSGGGGGAVLRRIGAAAVAEDLAALAGRLGAVVAANEAVHGGVYVRLVQALAA